MLPPRLSSLTRPKPSYGSEFGPSVDGPLHLPLDPVNGLLLLVGS